MTGIEPAYSAWEAISSAERPFYLGWSRVVMATQMPRTNAFLVCSEHAHGSVPMRLWFGWVGVPKGYR